MIETERNRERKSERDTGNRERKATIKTDETERERQR